MNAIHCDYGTLRITMFNNLELKWSTDWPTHIPEDQLWGYILRIKTISIWSTKSLFSSLETSCYLFLYSVVSQNHSTHNQVPKFEQKVSESNSDRGLQWIANVQQHSKTKCCVYCCWFQDRMVKRRSSTYPSCYSSQHDSLYTTMLLADAGVDGRRSWQPSSSSTYLCLIQCASEEPW